MPGTAKGPDRLWTATSDSWPLPLLQFPLNDSHPRPRLDFLVLVLASADGKEALISFHGRLKLLELVQNARAKKPVAGTLVAQFVGLPVGRERLRVVAHHIQHVA